MLFRYRYVLGGAMMIAGAMAFGADVYQVDVQHTTVGFSIRHMVINNVKGSFKDFDGTIEYDGKDPLTLRAAGSIKVASIDTGIQGRDEHLRGPEFFHATQYPEIAFRSERVEKRGNSYSLIGKFTMHGVTKEITLPFTVSGPVIDPWGKTRIGIETGLTLNRQDYGINWNKTLDNGGLIVGDEVKIEINVEAVKKVPEPPKK